MGIMPTTTRALPRRHTTVVTGLGDLLAVADGDALVGLYFPSHWHPPKDGTTGSRSRRPATRFESTPAARGVLLRARIHVPRPPAATRSASVCGTCGDDRLRHDPTYGAIAASSVLRSRPASACGRAQPGASHPCHRVGRVRSLPGMPAAGSQGTSRALDEPGRPPRRGCSSARRRLRRRCPRQPCGSRSSTGPPWRRPSGWAAARCHGGWAPRRRPGLRRRGSPVPCPRGPASCP